ncbi:GAF domain-containing protein [Pseudenhygromyxa sp. WMMC2535]|uniref:adenylate/guanylate cyclase domain-containing protein n=1 Tax=Pseudenhygromyxa sp. WMMC2535 TaxID=2712867 RepID=UPI001552A019|nr:adenylate/guanylate cyclase domain-containing protein [Pseudenhygromyxa sp. WMMC2535]NVB38230.1 GAF domain-containing protein [Pseudenhygromyxa sp. WMMC2535]NVB43585.1 GAF domain-containing protein [Pseudenhygromyxa sp. WMMC2535]
MPRVTANPGRADEVAHDLRAGEYTLGRGREADVRVNNKSLSRSHATLTIDERGAATLRDLGSKNGTFIEGARLDEPVALRDGQRFVCGDVHFAFHAPSFSIPAPESIVQEISTEASRTLLNDLLTGARDRRAFGARVSVPKEAQGRLRVMLEVTRLLAGTDAIDKQLTKILELVFTILAIDRAALILIDEDSGEFGPPVVEWGRGISADGGDPYSRNIINYVRERSVAALFSDTRADPRLEDAHSIHYTSVRSSMCAPLRPKDEVIGVLYVDNLSAPQMFSGEDLELLSAFAAQAAIAIDNARLYERLKRESTLRSNLMRFFPPTAVAQLMAKPGFADEAIETEVTVLFCDISGFTEMTGKLRPRDVVALLNRYFPRITEVVFRYEGTLEKYIGDALLAVWGAPFRHEDDALRAARAAVDMQQAVRELAEELSMEFGDDAPPLRVHIGLSSGPVAAGNIGSEFFLQYATIGETTNLASRICELAGPGEIALSESTVDRMRAQLSSPEAQTEAGAEAEPDARTEPGAGRPPGRLVGPESHNVRGREQPVTIYKLEYE